MVGAEIRVNNSLVGFNLRWGSLGNDATLGHDHDPVGNLLHHIHIVLDKYHGAAFTWQGLDEFEQALGQGRVDTVKWDIGARILLLVFAAVTLGGLGTSYGALVGALMVGIAINWSTLVIDPELKNMTALVMLILALLLRPQGILGQKQRIG